MTPDVDFGNVREIRRDLFGGRAVRDAAAVRRLLEPLGLHRGPVLIKVNWFCDCPGQFTAAATLQVFCDAITDLKIVLEGHAPFRNDGTLWVAGVDTKGKWSQLREQERGFFERRGLARVLARPDVVYVNVTDEVWGGAAVPADEVRAELGARALLHQELYGVLPARLLQWRGRPLISLARMKIPVGNDGGGGFSLSLKNMFGLIPDPDRSHYHERLGEAVVDVNVLYGAYFDVHGCAEALTEAAFDADEGPYLTPWGGRYRLQDVGGMVIIGRKPAEVDAFTGALWGVDLSETPVLRQARARLGEWDRMLVLEAGRYRYL